MGKTIEHVDDLSEEQLRKAVGEVRIHLRQAVIGIHRGIQMDFDRPYDPSTLTKKRSRKTRRKKKTEVPSMGQLFNPAIQAVLIKHNFSPIALSLLLFIHKTFKLTYRRKRGRKKTDRGKFVSAYSGNWERWIKEKLRTKSQLLEVIEVCDEWEIQEVSKYHRARILRTLEGHKFWDHKNGSGYPDGSGTSIRTVSGGLPGLGKNN